MLKAKSKLSSSRNKIKAFKEVKKEIDMRGVYVKIPASYYKKLQLELLDRRMSMAEWVKEQINEL